MFGIVGAGFGPATGMQSRIASVTAGRARARAAAGSGHGPPSRGQNPRETARIRTYLGRPERQPLCHICAANRHMRPRPFVVPENRGVPGSSPGLAIGEAPARGAFLVLGLLDSWAGVLATACRFVAKTRRSSTTGAARHCPCCPKTHRSSRSPARCGEGTGTTANRGVPSSMCDTVKQEHPCKSHVWSRSAQATVLATHSQIRALDGRSA